MANLFSDLKVLDIATYIAGPGATTILSDFGADVIKIEAPGMGDPYRDLFKIRPNPESSKNYMWQLTNRNKRSMTLNLKSPRAQEAYRLGLVNEVVPAAQLRLFSAFGDGMMSLFAA